MTLKPLSLAALLISMVSSVVADPFYQDDFDSKEQERRRAMRGDWVFQENTASVTQDDELYVKYKDHGPIIFWDLKLEDADIAYSFKAEKTKTVVFTANSDDGHVFRFILAETGLNIRAFPPDSEAKSIALNRLVDQKLVQGAWTDVRVQLKGETAVIQIGKDFETTVSHPSLARAKSNISVGFSFGSLEVKGLVVTTPGKE